MRRYSKWAVSSLLVTAAALLGTVVSPITASASGGYNQYGYNDTARIFNGTYAQWCQSESISASSCSAYTFGSVNDQLIMKWNAAWDNCNKLGTPAACAGAWLDNESNGRVPGGSGYVWHYKIVWNATCTGYPSSPSDPYPSLSNGGYCIWGTYEVLMDQGTFNGVHTSNTLATPNGYGVY